MDKEWSLISSWGRGIAGNGQAGGTLLEEAMTACLLVHY